MENNCDKMYMQTNDLLPYRCPSCGSGKRFRSLVALRMHMSVLHPLLSPTSNNPYENSITEKLPASCLENNWDYQLSFSSDVDAIFKKYSARMDDILSRYNNESKMLESKLKMAKQLEEIRRQKEELQLIKSRWKATCGMSQLINDTDELLNKRLSGEQNDVCAPRNKVLKSSTRSTPAAPSSTNPMSFPAANSFELQRQVQFSVDLAAQYKSRAAEAEKKLQDKTVEEHHMKAFIQDLAQKEAVAKQKLSDMMEQLLRRAETAEEELEPVMFDSVLQTAKMYRSQSPSTNLNTSRSPKLSPRSRRKAFGGGTSASAERPFNRNRPKASRSPLGAEKTTPKMHKSYDKRRDKAENANRSTTRSPSPFLESDPHDFEDELLARRSPNSLGLRRERRPQDRAKQNCPVTGRSKPSPFSNKAGSRQSREAREAVLFCVFAHLRTFELLDCALVCREWRDVSRHPQLWSRIKLEHLDIQPQLLVAMSHWSSETCLLSLRNIGKVNPTLDGSDSVDLGGFEQGLESILKSCGDKLLVFSIDDCDPFITSRSLWLLSCYNKKVQSVTYRSSLDPLNHQVAWMLGTACRDIVSLEVAPSHPCSSRGLFTNNVVRLMSWCWPQLQALSFGGLDTDGAALLAVALNCQHIKVIEMEHAKGVNKNLAVSVCKHGLRDLKTLLFTHTPVSPATVRHFLENCSLHLLSVTVAQEDYFPKMSRNGKVSPEYRKIEASLSKLQRDPIYSRILEVQCL